MVARGEQLDRSPELAYMSAANSNLLPTIRDFGSKCSISPPTAQKLVEEQGTSALAAALAQLSQINLPSTPRP